MRVILFGLSVMIAVCVPASSAFGAIDTEKWIASAPTGFADEQKLCAAVFEQGPDAIKALAARLDHNTSPARLQTLLQSLSMYAGQQPQHHAVLVQALSEALGQLKDPQAQDFVMELLGWAGNDAAVDALAAFLTDARLCDPAARTLTAIGTPKATAALKRALTSGKATDVSAVILALGTLQAEEAVSTILPYTKNTDAMLRHSALWALANIGHEPAAPLIAAALAESNGYAKAQAEDNRLLLARRLAEKGQTDQAAAMCRALLADGKAELHVLCGALDVLVAAEGEKALRDLLAAARSGKAELAAAAIAQTNRISSSAATRQYVDLLEDVDAFVGEHVLMMLGKRGDLIAFDAVAQRFDHADENVTGAAMRAAILLDRQKAMPALIDLLKKTEEPWRFTLAIDHLMRMPGQDALIASASQLGAMPSATRIKLMEGLARRRATSCSRYILAQTAEEPPVHQAALRALATCAAAEDLETILTRMLGAQNHSEKNGFQQAAVTAVLQIEKTEKRADPVLARLEGAADANRDLLLRILGRTGSPKAFDVIVAATQNSGSKDAAIRALADWPEVTAVPELMQLVQTEELRYQVIALRSALTLMNESTLDNAERLAYAKKAAQAVSRPEEKRLLMSFVGQIRTNEALAFVEPYLSDLQLTAEAALSAAQIALPAGEKDRGLTGTTAIRVLQKAQGAVNDDALKQRIADHLKAMPPMPTQKTAPEGFTTLFNGKDLTGWKGVMLPPYDNPIRRAALSAEDYAVQQANADANMRTHWSADDGVLYFDGKGFSLATAEDYEDFELYVDWRIEPRGDSGIYLRGSPQVQIWDPTLRPEGSGGLFNNQIHPSKPLVCADNPVGQWNSFYIKMVGERVTVRLNDTLVVDNIPLENYWDLSQRILPTGPIELQCHGDPVWFANIFLRRIPPEQREWVSLFNEKDLTGWTGDTKGYAVEDGTLIWRGGGNLYTEKQYGNFHFTCEFLLTPGANNGIGIRTPLQGNPSYEGMEIQILDDTDEKYAGLQPWQYCGSIYGIVPAQRGHLNPLGQWNQMEIIADGRHITVILNENIIVDADIGEFILEGTPDGKPHPGLENDKGHIALLGHRTIVAFRNLQVIEL